MKDSARLRDPSQAAGQQKIGHSSVVWVLLHDLGRTGVPVALQRMTSWLAGRPDLAPVELHVVAVHDGPLAYGIGRSVRSLVTLEPAVGRSLSLTASVTLAQTGMSGAGRSLVGTAWRRRTRHLPKPDVVLLHGAGAFSAWQALGPQIGFTVDVVVHLHELEEALTRSIAPGDLHPLLRRASRVLVVSGPVADLAITAGAVPSSVRVVPGTCEDQVEGAGEPSAKCADAGAQTVVGIGEAGWRKGTDRFVAVAHELARTHPSVRSRWIGAPPGPAWTWSHDVRLPLTWSGSRPDPWLGLDPKATVLVVPSREDPLPLVALEAGARGIPVVAAASGGLQDLLAQDRGILVDGHDLSALVGAVTRCIDEPAETRARAERLRRHVHQHFRPEVVGPRWLDAIIGTDSG